MLAIRLPSDTAFPSLRVTLDGAEYLISLAWNQREGKWYLALSDSEGTPILSGVKVVADFPLLTLAKHDSACPPGEILASDTSGQGLDPFYDDMSGDSPRVILMYATKDEVAALV